MAPTSGDIQVEELKQRLDKGDDIFRARCPASRMSIDLQHQRLSDSLGDLPKRVSELDSSKEIVAHCRSGVSHAKAVDFLKQAGFKKVHNLAGGILAWADRVNPKMPKY